MTDKKTFKGFPLDSRGDVIGAFPTVDVIQERTKDLMNEVTGNINQMTIDYCLKFNIDPDVLIKQKAEIELLQMKIADIKANCDLAIEGRDIKIKELEQQIEKMKCCFNCKHSRTEYEHCRTDKHEKWEIKENGR